jgi:hypothetical protein
MSSRGILKIVCLSGSGETSAVIACIYGSRLMNCQPFGNCKTALRVVRPEPTGLQLALNDR